MPVTLFPSHDREESPQALAEQFNPLNWRGHPELQAAATEESLDKLGWLDEVKINKVTGKMFDGHLRVTLALTKGETSVPVKYYELTEDEEALALQVFDATTELAEPIADKLTALMERTKGMRADTVRLNEMLEGVRERAGLNGQEETVRDVEPQIDKAEELREKWGTALGQVWELGGHRLPCGS